MEKEMPRSRGRISALFFCRLQQAAAGCYVSVGAIAAESIEVLFLRESGFCDIRSTVVFI